MNEICQCAIMQFTVYFVRLTKHFALFNSINNIARKKEMPILYLFLITCGHIHTLTHGQQIPLNTSSRGIEFLSCFSLFCSVCSDQQNN